MQTPKALLLTALFIGPALAADQWTWVSTENLCAGTVANCTDKVSCTKFATGPCKGETTTTPTAYITAEFVGAAFVDHDKYLDDPTQMQMLDFKGPGFRDGKASITNAAGGGECSNEVD